MTRLYAARFENNDTSAAPLENFGALQDVRVRWSLPGGVQRIEIVVKTSGPLDLYRRMNEHMGQRLAIYDATGYRPASGNIYEIAPINSHQVRYIAKGPWQRHYDLHDTTIYAETDTNDEVVETVLTDHVSVASSDYSNIDAAGTAVNGWQPAAETGSLPGDIIQEMADMSDSSNNTYDYWLIDQPFSGAKLQQYVAYFKARTTTGTPDYRVYIRDMSTLRLSRTITDLRNDVTVYYGTVGGDASSANAAGTQLTDSGASFITAGVLEGDSIYNETDGSSGRITSVAATVLQHSELSGGTDDDWGVGDVYSIRLQDLQPSSSTASPLDPFEREYREKVPDMDATQAAQYAAALRTRLDRPTQFASFTITAPYIQGGSGGRVSLFDVVKNGGGVIQVADLYPAAALLSSTSDNLTTFFITALDYDYRSNALRVTVENPDNRLDARLVRAGILSAEGAFA